jgi:hypothetical protein
MKMIVRKDGHWKEVVADNVDDAKKKVDAEFADLQQPVVLILPDGAQAAPAKKAK